MNRNINIIIGRPVFDRTINPKQRLNGIDVFINIDENENLQYFFVSDHLGSSSFITDAGGERVWKLTGKVEQLSLNGGMVIDMATLTNKTLYTSPYMVINDQEYTKYFYAGSQRQFV